MPDTSEKFSTEYRIAVENYARFGIFLKILSRFSNSRRVVRERGQNGRIVIALDKFLDDNSESSHDCSVSDLSHYRLVKNFKTEENIVRYPGTWQIPFTLQFQDTARKFTLNKSLQTSGGCQVTIQKLSLSNLFLSCSGKCKIPHSMQGDDGVKDDALKADLCINNIKLIMKDGSAVEVGQKFSGGMDADGSFEFEGNLQTLIDAKQVTAIEIFRTRIPLKS